MNLGESWLVATIVATSLAAGGVTTAVAGTLTQFDATGAHVLGGGVQAVGVAFGPAGQVLEVVSVGGTLTQFDATGGHVLFGGVQDVGVAFGPAGQVLEVVFSDATTVPEPATCLLVATGLLSLFALGWRRQPAV